MSMLELDPWEVARRHYERQMHLFMARLMRHFGVTQIELSNRAIPADAVIDIVGVPEKDATFYRIKGHLTCDAAQGSPSQEKT